MDGVICEIDSSHYINRSPIIETINLMKELKRAGHIVIIHTGRHIDKLIETKKWLKEYKVEYDHIQFGKPVADVYIDDKGMRFEGIWTKENLEYLR